jgi:hypothetical protein
MSDGGVTLTGCRLFEVSRARKRILDINGFLRFLEFWLMYPKK